MVYTNGMVEREKACITLQLTLAPYSSSSLSVLYLYLPLVSYSPNNSDRHTDVTYLTNK